MKKRGFVFILAICFILFLPTVSIQAASVSITFGLGNSGIQVEDTFEVSILLTSEEIIGDFEGYITYNSEIVEFLEGPSCVTGSGGLLKIKDQVLNPTSMTRKYVLRFQAVNRGYCEFGIGKDAEVYDFETGSLMSVSSTVLGFQVGAFSQASFDASLSALKISPGILKPDFDPDIFEYNTTVEAEKLIVSAIPSDTDAKVSVKGNEALLIGENKVLVVVTAADGTEQTYTILVKREEATSPITTIVPSVDDAAGLKEPELFTVEALKKEEKTFLQSAYRYLLIPVTEEIKIPEGYEKTSIFLDGITITAYLNTKETNSDFLLLYLQKEGSQAGFYTYDKQEKTLQRYSNQRSSQTVSGSIDVIAQPNESEMVESYEKSTSVFVIVIVVLSGVCILLALGLITTYIRYQKR